MPNDLNDQRGSGSCPVPEKKKEDLTSSYTRNHVSTTVVSSDSTSTDGMKNAPASGPAAKKRKHWLFPSRSGVISIMIALVGTAACAIILVVGILAIRKKQDSQFERLGSGLENQFQIAVDDYFVAGSWVHQACRERLMDHARFRQIYDYIVGTGLEFQFISCMPNVTHEERPAFENHTRDYLGAIGVPPGMYRGFVGVQLDPNTGQLMPIVQPPDDFYFPMHFLEPMETEGQALDFNVYSVYLRETIDRAVQTWAPAATARVRYVLRPPDDPLQDRPGTYHFGIFYPGMRLPVVDDGINRPTELSIVSVYIPDLIERAFGSFEHSLSSSVYIYDSTVSAEQPDFLGGAHIRNHHDDDNTLVLADEIAFDDLQLKHFDFVSQIQLSVESREWTFIVATNKDAFDSELPFVILGAAMIFVASSFLALWVFTNHRRTRQVNALKYQAESEKAENARRAARSERELNDFIAHEVRNPLSAAISACSFVSSAVQETPPLVEEASQIAVREDVAIIDNSLQFINDLLRNMLDIHRANNKQLNIDMVPVDIKCDVFEPVVSMLYRRGDNNIEVLVECPEDLLVVSDLLRLKQIVLNLARNSLKFVNRGFVRLRATTEDGPVVRIYIEDSGPGIPLAKRNLLFTKFQESLDSLNQGTGIGLCLCKELVELMGGEIWLDETYTSSIENCPGARFVVDLKRPPVSVTECNGSQEFEVPPSVESTTETRTEHPPTKALPDGSTPTDPAHEALEPPPVEIPDRLLVLLVDDDRIVRKLFMRAVKRIAPNWNIQEAANGETAVRMAESDRYDAMFIDQYMASTDRQMLGTETVRRLRSNGVDSIICGLSANDLEQPFVSAGADAFMMKPFPCDADELRKEFTKILNTRRPAIEVGLHQSLEVTDVSTESSSETNK